ncbi:unnamed protein product, partial [Pylaiella littoralis]
MRQGAQEAAATAVGDARGLVGRVHGALGQVYGAPRLGQVATSSPPGMATRRKGEMLVETDFIEKLRHEARVVLTCATAPTTIMMVALVHHSPDDRGEHQTDAWMFLSADPNHDFDFHHAAMDVIFEYYITGAGSAATAGIAAPRVHMFTDGCGKQYKGKRNFRAVAQSLYRLGIRLFNNFAVTSHFKGAHDGIGGLIKNLIRNAERYGERILDCDAAHQFLVDYPKVKEEKSEGHFATRSPYRITSFQVRKFGPEEVPRPQVDLTGISGSSKLYQLMGAEEQDSVQGVGGLVQATSVEVQTGDFGVVEAEDKMLTPKEWVTGSSVVWKLAQKFQREWKLRVRRGSGYCSTCRVGRFDECMVAKVYPDLVGEVTAKVGKEKGFLRTLWTQMHSSLADGGTVVLDVFSWEGKKGNTRAQPRSRGQGRR